MKSRGSNVGSYPPQRGPTPMYPQSCASPRMSPSCLSGTQTQYLSCDSSLISRSGSMDPLGTQNPPLGPHSRRRPPSPTTWFLPGTCIGYLPPAWSSGLSLLVLRLAKLPRPTAAGCPPHLCPHSICEFYLCLEKVSVSVNCRVFSISSFDYNTVGKQWCLINVFSL